MPNPIWPTSLPDIQYPAPGSGYNRAAQQQALRTQMDAGPAKLRRRFSAAAKQVSITIEMSGAQVATLETFYGTTLGVVGVFDWVNHLTRAAAAYRFVEPPAYSPIAADWWSVSLVLEEMP